MSLSDIPASVRKTIAERDGGRCCYCGMRQYGQGAVFHVDHILPRSRGGATSLANLVLQCPYCSLHKSNKVEAVDAATGLSHPLYHPLRQVWSAHFRLRSDGECEGTTATGRATILALRMNDPIPKTARASQLAVRIIEID